MLVVWFACAEWCGGWGLVLVGGGYVLVRGGLWVRRVCGLRAAVEGLLGGENFKEKSKMGVSSIKVHQERKVYSVHQNKV